MEQKASALFVGAGRGIGRTFALEAARRGVTPTVVATSFAPNDTELAKAGPNIIADVASAAGMNRLRRERIWHAPYVFWTAGAYRRAEFADMELDRDRMLMTHQTAMLNLLQEMHRDRLVWRDMPAPASAGIPRDLSCTLVVMGSISSYKLRKGEAVYAMAKAGQAAFLRNYAVELAEDFPGSRVLLVNSARLGDAPGEQKLDAGGRRIDPGEVSRLVWNLLLDERRTVMDRPFTQVNIERDSNGAVFTYGPQLPEIP